MKTVVLFALLLLVAVGCGVVDCWTGCRSCGRALLGSRTTRSEGIHDKLYRILQKHRNPSVLPDELDYDNSDVQQVGKHTVIRYGR